MRKNKEIPTVNMLSLDTDLDGNIKVNSDIRIDGNIKGDVTCKGKLTLGKSGVINGNIICDDAEISGVVNGNIKSSGLITLKESSTFNGDIDTVKIMVEFGTNLVMNCKTKVSSDDEKKALLKVSELAENRIATKK